MIHLVNAYFCLEFWLLSVQNQNGSAFSDEDKQIV